MYKAGGFDSVALYYDWLVRAVFGKSMARAQAVFLDKINDNKKVLVLGGGNGSWLREFLKMRPGCEVVYIEASLKMMETAKKKTSFHQRIEYRVGTEELLRSAEQFDVIVTFCYMDLFSQKDLERVIHKIMQSAKANAAWLVTDFVSEKWWHRMMLAVMYRFFRLFANLRNQRLPEWNDAMKRMSVKKIDEQFFYHGFIKSVLYEVSA